MNEYTGGYEAKVWAELTQAETVDCKFKLTIIICSPIMSVSGSRNWRFVSVSGPETDPFCQYLDPEIFITHRAIYISILCIYVTTLCYFSLCEPMPAWVCSYSYFSLVDINKASAFQLGLPGANCLHSWQELWAGFNHLYTRHWSDMLLAHFLACRHWGTLYCECLDIMGNKSALHSQVAGAPFRPLLCEDKLHYSRT